MAFEGQPGPGAAEAPFGARGQKALFLSAIVERTAVEMERVTSSRGRIWREANTGRSLAHCSQSDSAFLCAPSASTLRDSAFSKGPISFTSTTTFWMEPVNRELRGW